MDEDRSRGRIVVVGASAGGVEALLEVVGALPHDFPAPVLVVLHVGASSSLPGILQRAGKLPVTHAVDGQRLEPGRVLVAPPDRHLMVVDGHVRVVRGPRENLHRPAVDPLFRSAALSYGPDAIAVVLSGTREDGAAGAAAVSGRGGAVVVQEPDEAVYPDMPRSAIAADNPDYVLPLAEIPATIARLVTEERKEETVADTQDLDAENRYAALDLEPIENVVMIGKRGPFGCPECGGVLWERDDRGLLRFRCRVGHAFAADTLVEAQRQTLDTALWVALRALEERASLARRVRDRMRAGGNEVTASRYDQAIEESERHANVIRAVLAGQGEAA